MRKHWNKHLTDTRRLFETALERPWHVKAQMDPRANRYGTALEQASTPLTRDVCYKQVVSDLAAGWVDT